MRIASKRAKHPLTPASELCFGFGAKLFYGELWFMPMSVLRCSTLCVCVLQVNSAIRRQREKEAKIDTDLLFC